MRAALTLTASKSNVIQKMPVKVASSSGSAATVPVEPKWGCKTNGRRAREGHKMNKMEGLEQELVAVDSADGATRDVAQKNAMSRRRDG